MKEVIVAFDIDGTIYGSPFLHKGEPVLNLETVQIMQLFRKHIKNVKIIAWSGGGREYAQQIITKFGLEKYVDGVIAKQEYDEILHGKIDIAFDDEYNFTMADKNLIVRTK